LRKFQSFNLVNQDEQPVRGANYTGKSGFTTCGWEGPAVTERFNALSKRFGGRDDVSFVSFSIDPTPDQPRRLFRYAAIAKADPKHLRRADCRRLPAAKNAFLGEPPSPEALSTHTPILATSVRGNIPQSVKI